MKVNWNFPGGGVQNKKPSMGQYGYFLELHNTKCNVKFLMSSIIIIHVS